MAMLRVLYGLLRVCTENPGQQVDQTAIPVNIQDAVEDVLTCAKPTST